MDTGISIVYQDEYLLVVDKPAGLLSVPGRLPENFDSVALRLKNHVHAQARIVHRLDCDTSGIMVLALDADSHRELSRQFHDREVAKIYEALVFGAPQANEGEINLPLRYDADRKPRHCVDHVQGKPAQTFWKVLDRAPLFTRVELRPYTGRSHQLRVHMLSLGHPMLGDSLYADGLALAAAARLCLHARELQITHPGSGQSMTFFSPTPF